MDGVQSALTKATNGCNISPALRFTNLRSLFETAKPYGISLIYTHILPIFSIICFICETLSSDRALQTTIGPTQCGTELSNTANKSKSDAWNDSERSNARRSNVRRRIVPGRSRMQSPVIRRPNAGRTKRPFKIGLCA